MIVPDDKTPLFPAMPFNSEHGWRSDAAPPDGSTVNVFAQDHRGYYEIPFAVLFQDDAWLNKDTGEELDVYVAGWRPHGSGASA